MKKTIITSIAVFLSLTAIVFVSCKKNNIGPNNCDDNYISILDSCGCLYAPNVFSPNGDGVNDIYGPIGMNISSLTLTIKDTNQNVLYIGNGVNSSWDGKVNNQIQPETFYEARIQATLCNSTVDTTTCFYLGKYTNGCIPKYTSSPILFMDQVDPVTCTPVYPTNDSLCP